MLFFVDYALIVIFLNMHDMYYILSVLFTLGIMVPTVLWYVHNKILRTGMGPNFVICTRHMHIEILMADIASSSYYCYVIII